MGCPLAVVLLTAVAVAAGAECEPARGPVGILAPLNGDAATLARVDLASLRATGPRVRLGEYHDAWSFSPDRSRLALGMGGAGPTCGRGICIVDLDTMRIAAEVDAPTAVEAVAWPRPRRVVGVLQTGGVVVADPGTGAIVQRTPLPFTTRPGAWARTPAGLALLMAGRPLRLVVADATGSVRVAPLSRIRLAASGFPGLAVDRRGTRAFVVAARAPVAEVDLTTMRVSYHRVALPRARGRPGTRFREALWLGNGLMAVFGDDDSASAPTGVHVIDTETWTARTVHPRAGRARLAPGRLLVYTWDVITPPRARGVGLRVYTRDGRRLVSHLLGSQALDVEVAGSRAYAYRAVGRGRALHTVRVRSGTIVRASAPPPREYDVEILGGP